MVRPPLVRVVLRGGRVVQRGRQAMCGVEMAMLAAVDRLNDPPTCCQCFGPGAAPTATSMRAVSSGGARRLYVAMCDKLKVDGA